mgnify:CR=1 FL=1
MNFSNQLDFALELDASDPLKSYRDLFHIPIQNGAEVAYFTGNSLGLQPKSARAYVERVMKDWETMAVEGHFYSKEPWWEYHEKLAAPLASLVGAKTPEVSVYRRRAEHRVECQRAWADFTEAATGSASIPHTENP